MDILTFPIVRYKFVKEVQDGGTSLDDRNDKNHHHTNPGKLLADSSIIVHAPCKNTSVVVIPTSGIIDRSQCDSKHRERHQLQKKHPKECESTTACLPVA